MNLLSLCYWLPGLKAFIGARVQCNQLFPHFQPNNTLWKATRKILQKQMIKAFLELGTMIGRTLGLVLIALKETLFNNETVLEPDGKLCEIYWCWHGMVKYSRSGIYLLHRKQENKYLSHHTPPFLCGSSCIINYLIQPTLLVTK